MKIKQIKKGPIGRNGFRSGKWEIVLNDNTIHVIRMSVPHQCSINEQKELIESRLNLNGIDFYEKLALQ